MKSKSSLKSTIKAVAAALCVVSACAYGANLPQVAFHVSPTGDDAADGSLERPFATVTRARDAVRVLKKSGALPKGGVNVWLRGGEYPMCESFVLGKEDSGADGAPVAYRAWKGERPVLTGAWTVPPSAWRKADDPRIPAEAKGKVWVADVKSLGYDALEPDALCGFHTARPKFRIRSLTCNGKRLTLARHPNTGFLRTGTVIDKAGVFKADLGDMTRWSRANAPDLEALGYWRYLWADQTVPVCVDPAAGTVSFAPAAADSGTDAETSFHLSQTSAAASKSGRLYSIMVCAGMPFYLQNALAALDAPGEWHLDRTTGLLYVCPEDAKGDPSKCRYELSLAAKSLVSAKDAAHIRFEGIAFRGGRHHGVEMRGVSDVKIENCDFRDFGGHGLVLDHARDSLVRGCSFRTFGHSAMTLDGGDRKTLTPSGVTIDSCSFSDTGLAMRTYTPGIWVTGCGHRIVRNNFHDLPSSAVRIGGNEHLFASNLVERVVMESDDQGAVDMWGDPTYRGNKFIHNIFRDVGCGGAFVRCGQGGIRFDDSISGNLVYGNRFDNCSKANFGGVQIHGGRDNVVRNNVFTRCRYGITVSPWSQDHWRKFLSGERGKTSRAEANVEGAAFKAKYPEFASALDAPMRNTFEFNVYEGEEKSFTRRAPAPTVMRGNVCVPKLPADLSSIPGFEPLPPESAIGRREVGSVSARSKPGQGADALEFRYPRDGVTAALLAECKARGITITDWHLHIRGGMTPEMAAERERASGILSSAMENHGREWNIHENSQLAAFAAASRKVNPKMPVGTQVNDRDWFLQIDAATRAQLDYVLADTMIMGKLPDGRDRRLWLIKDISEIGDPEKWMEQYMAHNLQILGEPISILANPTYLPAPLAPMYDKLWTEARMKAVIAKAVERGIALEVQAESKFPSEKFLRLAKSMGAKFSFGTNNFDPKPKDLSRWLWAIRLLDMKNSDVWTPKALACASGRQGK